MRCNNVLSVALGLALLLGRPALVQSQTSGVSTVAAGDGPGGAASWTTGNKLAVGASAGTDSKVWFTVAKGITSEIFYPRLDVPNMEDMQYIVTDGSTFVDLERDATSHVISMPTEDALEYIVTNTDKRQSPKYRITDTYVTDPSRDTLLIRLRIFGWRRLPTLPACEPQHRRRRREQLGLVGWDPFGAHGQRDANSFWLADDDRLGAESCKSKRLRRERQRLCDGGERLRRRIA
jgi:hypothetical protein